MYGLAFVILPQAFDSLQDELDRSLSPFKRGGEADFPFESLAFDDWTPWLEEAWRAELDLRQSTSGLSYGHANASMTLAHKAMLAFLDEHGGEGWRGRLIDVEPDFTTFAHRFTDAPLDPRTGRFGQWLNPHGHWDWWELGGRFDGFVTGQPRPARDSQKINSGPSAGRDILGSIGEALAEALGGDSANDEAEVEANVELVETVLSRLRDDPGARWPTAVVRPLGSASDSARWIEDEFFRPMPAEARRGLDLPEDAPHRNVMRAALMRHSHGVVAGVAYHC